MDKQIPRNIKISIERDSGNNQFETRQLILRKGKSETALHIILELLAYLYFWNFELLIEPQFRYRKYRPDLISFKEPEIPLETEREVNLWIECKKVKLRKLIKLGRTLPYSNIFWFQKFEILNRNLNNVFSKRKYPLPTNIHLIGIKLNNETWNILQSSLFIKHPSWKFIRQEKEIILFSCENLKIPLKPLKFHHF
ncbi:MAG: hypothetical protein ACFFCQ_13430 [Promethearchaeota archaeon]